MQRLLAPALIRTKEKTSFYLLLAPSFYGLKFGCNDAYKEENKGHNLLGLANLMSSVMT